MNNKLSKILAATATVAAVAGSILLISSALAASPADYGLKEGWTISAAGSNDPDVYIVNQPGYKRIFLNPAIFNFYGHLGGFANVHNVSAATRDAFPTSGLFTDCQVGSANNDGKVYGVEVTGEDTGMLHWVNTTGAAAVAADANFFAKVFCINDNEFNWYAKGANYTSVSQVPNYSRVPGATPTPSPSPTPTPSGPLSASLSSDNPASGTVVAGQGVADLLHITVMNPGSSAVAVNSLQFKRLGISGDSTLSNTYVYLVGGARLTDSTTPTSGIINVNGGTSSTAIVTVPAGGSVNLAFRTDIAGSTSGQTLGVALLAVNGVAVSGLSGNLFTVAAAPSDLATAQFAAAASLIPATGGVTSDPLKDTIVWQDTVTISNKNVLLKSFALRQTNSINSADVNNFRLFVDGVQIAQVQSLDANGYVTFMPASSATILTGSRTVKVLADIIGGTSRKLTMSLRSTADVQVIDSNYGVNLSATLASGTFPLTAGDITINSGSIVVQKDATSPSGNVVRGGSDVVLGRWILTAYGEPTKVSTLIAGLQSTANGAFVIGTAALRNGRIMAYPVGNPSAAQQYGSTAALKYSATASTSYTTNLTVNPGQPLSVEVRADVYDSGSTTDTTAAAQTLTAGLFTGASNGQGMVSLTTSNVPSAQNNANQLTIQSGSMSITKYAAYPDQTIVLPATGRKIGDFIVTGSTNEAINVNTLTLDITAAATGVVGDLSNVYIKWNGVNTSIKSSVTATGNSYSLSNTQLAVNGSVHAEVYADIINRSGSPTYQSKLLVAGTTVTSAIAVNTNSNATFAGQTMTGGTGSIVSSVAASNPVSQIVAANSTTEVAKFSFVATNDTFNITELQIKTVASASEGGIASVILKKADGTVIGSVPLSLSGSSRVATFGSLTGLSVPSNDPNGITLTAAVQVGNVGVGAASTALNVGLTLDYFKNTTSSGTLSTDNNDRAGNAQYLHNAYPVVTAVALPSVLLTNGTQTFAKFSIISVGAANSVVGFQQILLNVAKSTGPSIASSGMQLFEDGVDVTSTGAFTTAQIGTSQTAGTVQFKFTAERQSPVSGHVYEFKANITNTVANDSIATSFKTPSANAAPNTAAVVNATTTTLSWTDRSGSSHSLTTADWMNDNLVKTLPFTQALSR